MAELSAQQRADLATLLAQHLTIDGLRRLADSVLGGDITKDAANVVNDVSTFAPYVVDAFVAADRISEAIALVRSDFAQNVTLILELDRLFRPPADEVAYQNFRSEYEPFIRSKEFQQLFPRVRRTVCLVAINKGKDKIRGTGFLIGPDLVMTNYHVVEALVKANTNPAEEVENTGDNIHCIFDYEDDPAPSVPPQDNPNKVARGASKGWLAFGRPKLLGDGTDTVRPFTNELDFVVIKLARPIGNLPLRPGGGVPRGWLTLEDNIDIANRPRIILFQHPTGSPQMIDIGPVYELDASKSRVRYWLNSANGSSGGAAIDGQGKLYAVHNATVKHGGKSITQGASTLNQGIRIDQIMGDIKGQAPGCLSPPPPTTVLPFWSLNDSTNNPEPIIGRSTFREIVREMLAPAGPRIGVVTGPESSGVRFSIRLLKRILGARIPVAEIGPDDLATMRPGAFLESIINQVGVAQPGTLPTPNEHEDLPQWFRRSLPPHLLKLMSEEHSLGPSRFPAWIVLNTVTPSGKPLTWANNLRDVVAALIGVRDADQAPFDIPYLRWLFLGRSANGFPLGNVERKAEDLATDTDVALGFAECMQAAWKSLDRDEDEISTGYLVKTAGIELRDNPGKLPRVVLAERVRKYFI